ncbi:MAG: hypothetical protein H6733_10095 [Alphaproteobacteria bacterium]|nr:hypothetical protein [Alphaproteobacteria bacterium]
MADPLLRIDARITTAMAEAVDRAVEAERARWPHRTTSRSDVLRQLLQLGLDQLAQADDDGGLTPT